MKSWYSYLLGVLIGGIVLAFVFGSQYFRINLTQYEQVSKVLTELKDQDVHLNEHMLLIGNGILVNFDSLVRISKRLNALQKKLIDIQNGMSGKEREDMKNLSNQLIYELNKKVERIEEYKASYAILRNSQAFIPREISHIAPLLWIEKQAKLYDLSSDVSAYIATPKNQLQQHILSMIKAFKEDEDTSDTIRNIFKHIQIVLNKRNILHDLSYKVLQQPTAQLIEKMEGLRGEKHANMVRHNDNLMVIMSALALIALLVVIIVIYRLRSIASQMKETLSELEYQKFALDQHSIVAAADHSGRITYANDNFCEISQYTQEELLGEDHRILNSGYHPRSFFVDMWKTIANGKTWHGEIQNKRKDGSLYWVDTTITPFMGKHGKVERYIAIRTDITRRKEEEERSISLARFPAENPSPIMRVDHLGIIIYANHACQDILNEMNLSIGDPVPDDVKQDCMAVLNSKTNRQSELSIGQRTFELTFSSMNNANDVNIYARDISEIKRSIEAIAGSEKRIRQVMDTALDGMIMLDDEAQVTYWNPQAERLFGWTSHEMIWGNTLGKIFPKEHLFETKEQLLNKMNQRTEMIGMHKEGYHVHVEVSVLTLQTNGVFDYFSIIIHDISERIESEKQLKKSRDLALESSRMKSMFLSTVSHEIRTPMNGIIGMTDLLLDTKLNTEQKEFSKTIQASSHALLTIINDILDFSKIEAGHMNIDCAAFSLQSMVEGSVGVVAMKAHAKKVILNMFIDPEIPEVLIGDEGRLRQILLNLVDNAVKFTAEGDVNVHVKCIQQVHDQVTVSFSIRDTGIGLSEESQQRLFQPFVQADGSTTRKYGGTGLGLAICKKLVQLMGGDIQLYSELGKGSMFSFELTFPISNEQELLSVAYDSHPLAGLSVFIADSDMNACFILKQYLSYWDMKVSSAPDSVSSLQQLQEKHRCKQAFDLIIIAENLSDKSGILMAEELQQIACLTGTPLIFNACHDQLKMKEKAKEVGFSAVLAKPINMSHLFNCVAQALNLDIMQSAIEEKNEHLDDMYEALPLEGIQVLLAEDNAVNQKVAQMHLAKLGCIVHTVGDGQEAMHAMMQSDTYDVILMDCQMPIMDGFKATKNIRAYEAGKGGHRRIIAMTANAMKGDRENCLQVGMDDYMSKPVSKDKISKVILRNLVNERDISHHEKDDEKAHEYYINLSQLRDLFGDDEAAVAEILHLFKQSMYEILMEKIPHALQLQDQQSIKSLAHELKGAAANIGGDDIAQLCSDMEKEAATGQWQKIQHQVDQLHHAYAQLSEMCIKLGVNK